MTDPYPVGIYYSDSEDSNEDFYKKNAIKSKIKGMYKGLYNYWNGPQTNGQPNEQILQPKTDNIGPMTKEEWQEIMAEANRKIRSLQFTAMEQKQHLNEYMKQIDDLVVEQQRLRTTHKTELSLIQNQNDHDRVSYLQQIEKLQKLRDDMTNKFQLTERRANLLLQEKVELETELQNIRISTTTSSHDIAIGTEQSSQQNTNVVAQKGSKDVNYWKQKALAFEAAVKDLTVKYDKEFKERRKLYNELQDLKGNIRVFARCRPLLKHEIKQNATEIASFPDCESISIFNHKNQTETFRFDKVFGPTADNEDVYKETAPYIQSVLDGYNVTIFAYGQTGSGKTYTMSSVNNNALNDLFKLQMEKKSEWIFETFVSMLEIYNENIIDLLDKKGNGKEYKIRMKGTRKSTQEIYVDGLKKVQVSGLSEVEQLMGFGASNRTVAHTKMNAESSRSHSLLVVYIKGENKTTGLKVGGKLNLIDLAGSERVKKSGVDGVAMKEAQNINKSLSALGDVIESLWKKNKHIPYRNSKLTFVLQDSLGKSAKTLMFINVSPADIHCQETLTSLRFAQRAKNVELGASTKNIV